MTITSLLLYKLWTCDVEELCCCVELTAAHVCFVQTAEHLSALFMTVVVWQFFSSLLCYVQDFSRISEKMLVVSRISAVFFTYHDNSAKPNISRNFFSAIQNLKKIRLGDLAVNRWGLYICRNVIVSMWSGIIEITMTLSGYVQEWVRVVYGSVRRTPDPHSQLFSDPSNINLSLMVITGWKADTEWYATFYGCVLSLVNTRRSHSTVSADLCLPVHLCRRRHHAGLVNELVALTSFHSYGFLFYFFIHRVMYWCILMS